MSPPTPASEPVRIIVVDSEACHFCEDAHRALAALAASYPLDVDNVDVRSEAGRALMARHRAPMSPLVLLDDTFFSSGRLPRRKLEKLLKGRYDEAQGAVTAARETHHG
ncbi:glutaredoxin [Nocardioides seonyuensis]|uniref:Glutaredoxin n=1 Tax=Nocardioides seonyuensis TaxID=2518371 RepID=A0A4P7IJ36_9ACTN|nr:glutaredoxin [Nocardioides seonyuensis]QBX56773.1 glutaredoxin [Nocardioides seonyuensis]